MGWLSLATMVAVSVVLYVASALDILDLGTYAERRRAVPTDLGLGSTGPATVTAHAGTIARRERNVSTIRLQPDRPADAVALDVPVPPDAEAVAHDPEAGSRATFSMLAAPGDVQEYYRDVLDARGWHEIWSKAWRPVFAAEGSETATSVFCRESTGPAIVVTAVVEDGGRCAVQVRIVGELDEPCGPRDPRTDNRPWLFSRAPIDGRS